jgi:hypothetical protein
MVVTVDIFLGPRRSDHFRIGGTRAGADLERRFVLRLAGDVLWVLAPSNNQMN